MSEEGNQVFQTLEDWRKHRKKLGSDPYESFAGNLGVDAAGHLTYEGKAASLIRNLATQKGMLYTVEGERVSMKKFPEEIFTELEKRAAELTNPPKK